MASLFVWLSSSLLSISFFCHVVFGIFFVTGSATFDVVFRILVFSFIVVVISYILLVRALKVQDANKQRRSSLQLVATHTDVFEQLNDSENEEQVPLNNKTRQIQHKAPIHSILLAIVATAFIIMSISFYIVFSPLIHPHGNLKTFALGSVGPTFLKLFIRNPSAPYVMVKFREEYGNRSWVPMQKVSLSNEFDHTTAVDIVGLILNTTYEVAVEFFMKTENEALTVSQFDNLRATSDLPLRVKTFPQEGQPSSFTFAFGSCVKTTWRSIDGFRRILDSDPTFTLFLGDLIYSDQPYFLGKSVANYQAQYRKVYADPHFSDLTQSKPFFTMYDDHEITNNWDGDQSDKQRYINAMIAWKQYAGCCNTDTHVYSIEKDSIASLHRHYYNFTYGQVGFFVVDTRGNRDGNNAPDDWKKTMLGVEQLATLKNWLIYAQKHSLVFKFLVSSVPWSANIRDTDSWFGFLHERDSILDFIQSQSIDNVIFISGDRHWAGIFELREAMIEFTVSPIDAFYVPKNTIEKKIGKQEKTIGVFDGQSYFGKIAVNTEVFPQVVDFELINEKEDVVFRYQILAKQS